MRCRRSKSTSGGTNASWRAVWSCPRGRLGRTGSQPERRGRCDRPLLRHTKRMHDDGALRRRYACGVSVWTSWPRWIGVLPASTLGALAMSFPVHWALLATFTHEDSFVQLSPDALANV